MSLHVWDRNEIVSKLEDDVLFYDEFTYPNKWKTTIYDKFDEHWKVSSKIRIKSKIASFIPQHELTSIDVNEIYKLLVMTTSTTELPKNIDLGG